MALRSTADANFLAVGRAWDDTSIPPGYKATPASYRVRYYEP